MDFEETDTIMFTMMQQSEKMSGVHVSIACLATKDMKKIIIKPNYSTKLSKKPMRDTEVRV